MDKSLLKDKADLFIPGFVRSRIKRIYQHLNIKYMKYKYIQKGKNVEFGYRFRFSCNNPYYAKIGYKSCLDDFNVWSAKKGSIIVGDHCWFGLNNIVIGPVEIGNKVMTGPFVSIVGAHHAVYSYDVDKDAKTEIGDNVWISTGSIILFGVKIGDNVVVGPGSVVNKNVPPNTYVAGNPARNLTQLTKFGGDIANIERL